MGAVQYLGIGANAVRRPRMRQCGRLRSWRTREIVMYASKLTVAMAVLAGLLLSSPAAFAQRGGGSGAGAQGRSGTRLMDRDRLSTHDMDRLHDRTLDRTQDRLHDRTYDRLYDRDLLRERDRDRIYGGNLMTTVEQTQYEQHLRSLATQEERVQFRMEHQHEMQMRAEERHERLGPAPSEQQVRTQERDRQQVREQVYGYSMMTPNEVARYQAQVGAARSEQERERIRTEHRRQMEERARARGESAPR